MDYGQNKPPICARVSGPEYQYMNSHGDTWYTTWELWADGGCIAQCEFGACGRPENVRAVFEAWNEVFSRLVRN